jgi:hypothetical protein
VNVDEEARAALWRQQQLQLVQQRVDALRALAAPPAPAQQVREAWLPVVLAIAERDTEMSSPTEALEEIQDRRNPFGCLIP